MARTKSLPTGSKGFKKPANAKPAVSASIAKQALKQVKRRKHAVIKRRAIRTGSMHRFLKTVVISKVDEQTRPKVRVSHHAATLAAHAVEDLVDNLLRSGNQLKEQIARVKIFQPEHLFYAFKTWSGANLAVPRESSKFKNLDRFVNQLDIRRRGTPLGAAALVHAMKSAKDDDESEPGSKKQAEPVQP